MVMYCDENSVYDMRGPHCVWCAYTFVMTILNFWNSFPSYSRVSTSFMIGSSTKVESERVMSRANSLRSDAIPELESLLKAEPLSSFDLDLYVAILKLYQFLS